MKGTEGEGNVRMDGSMDLAYTVNRMSNFEATGVWFGRVSGSKARALVTRLGVASGVIFTNG